MPVFIVVSLLEDTSALDASVEKNIPDEKDRYRLQADAGWLIDFNGTTNELCNVLKITGQAKGEKSVVGSALVTPVPNYYGRGPGDMWEWLKLRME